MTKLLDDPSAAMPPYRRTWSGKSRAASPSVFVLPTTVVFDNVRADCYTILSLFAYDQVGLLHRIARSLADLNIVLHFAKIDTHLDQIADVFYVTEADGSKIENDARQNEIRARLMNVVHSSE